VVSARIELSREEMDLLLLVWCLQGFTPRSSIRLGLMMDTYFWMYDRTLKYEGTIGRLKNHGLLSISESRRCESVVHEGISCVSCTDIPLWRQVHCLADRLQRKSLLRTARPEAGEYRVVIRDTTAVRPVEAPDSRAPGEILSRITAEPEPETVLEGLLRQVDQIKMSLDSRVVPPSVEEAEEARAILRRIDEAITVILAIREDVENDVDDGPTQMAQ